MERAMEINVESSARKLAGRFWMTALIATVAMPVAAQAEHFGTQVPMHGKGAATYYVNSFVTGLGPMEMMVDTGSGYLTINEEALQTLTAQGKALYVKQLRGVLANGSETVVPVYRLESFRIGKECWIHDVQAAVFPGRTRAILGLSALVKAAPFIYEFDPPRLTLSNCEKTERMAAATPAKPAQPLQLAQPSQPGKSAEQVASLATP